MRKWQLWLAALAAIPVLVWLASGAALMALTEDFASGAHLIKSEAPRPIPAGRLAEINIDGRDRPVELRTRVQGNSTVTSAIYADGTVARYWSESGVPVPQIDPDAARTIVAMRVVGGERVTAIRFFDETEPAPHLGRTLPVWQLTLGDGTLVYIGRDTGEVEAVRTRWWHVRRFLQSLHRLSGRPDGRPDNPLLIAAIVLAATAAIFSLYVALRRRRKSEDTPGAPSGNQS